MTVSFNSDTNKVTLNLPRELIQVSTTSTIPSATHSFRGLIWSFNMFQAEALDSYTRITSSCTGYCSVCPLDRKCMCLIDQTEVDGACRYCLAYCTEGCANESVCASNCVDHCVKCETPSTCYECESGYLQDASKTCQECSSIPGCIACTSASECTFCDRSFSLSGGKCVSRPCLASSNCEVCESDQKCIKCYNAFYMTSQGTCEACQSTCATCTSYSYCDSCLNSSAKLLNVNASVVLLAFIGARLASVRSAL